MTTETRVNPPFPEAIQISVALPRNWERAFGYREQSQWLAAWWEPAGDEAEYDDGCLMADGEWQLYLDLVDGRLAAPLAQAFKDNPRGRWALGSSDAPASHCLLLDLAHRHIFVAPLAQARRFLRQQQSGPVNAACPSDETLLEEVLEDVLWDIAREVVQGAQAEIRRGSFRPCPAHCQHGWLLAKDGGYDICPECDGQWLIAASPKPAASSPC